MTEQTYRTPETWEDCARHVEAGGVVECARLTSASWDAEQVGPDDYRDRSDAPGYGGYLRRRLVPIPDAPAMPPLDLTETEERNLNRFMDEFFAAPASESSTVDGEGEADADGEQVHTTAGGCSDSPANMTGAERYLADRMADPEYAAAYAATTLPTVPEGHELVVLPSEYLDWLLVNWAPSVHSYPWTVLADAARAAADRRPKPAPETERVPWCRAIGRTEPAGNVIEQVGADTDGPYVCTIANSTRLRSLVDPDGTVEVLKDSES